jgi:glyoxylase-like metal-dependent hydrolase (beta-lactamase superfamily II)
VLLLGFPSTAFATNCYVVAPAAGEECVIVDPGIQIEDRLAEVLTQHRLRPAAVLLTHGHVDHTYSVTPVCSGYGVAARIHSDDTYRLRDPLSDLDPGLIAMLEQQFGRPATWQEPSDVIEITGGTRLEIAGLDIGIRHAPGHTEGSVLFDLPGLPDGTDGSGGSHGEDLAATMLSGDVLFAGSIGRYDTKGGDAVAMRRTLGDVVLPLPDDLLVLPGHGPATTMAHERATNPYLLDLGLVA